MAKIHAEEAWEDVVARNSSTLKRLLKQHISEKAHVNEPPKLVSKPDGLHPAHTSTNGPVLERYGQGEEAALAEAVISADPEEQSACSALSSQSLLARGRKIVKIHNDLTQKLHAVELEFTILEDIACPKPYTPLEDLDENFWRDKARNQLEDWIRGIERIEETHEVIRARLEALNEGLYQQRKVRNEPFSITGAKDQAPQGPFSEKRIEHLKRNRLLTPEKTQEIMWQGAAWSKEQMLKVLVAVNLAKFNAITAKKSLIKILSTYAPQMSQGKVTVQLGTYDHPYWLITDVRTARQRFNDLIPELNDRILESACLRFSSGEVISNPPSLHYVLPTIADLDVRARPQDQVKAWLAALDRCTKQHAIYSAKLADLIAMQLWWEVLRRETQDYEDLVNVDLLIARDDQKRFTFETV